MKKELTVELGKKSSLFGGPGGQEFDDLDKVANELSTNKMNLLNSDIIKDINVVQIKIWHGKFINAIQFSYKVVTNDRAYSIEGNQHGSDKEKKTTINLEDDEYILKISGRHGSLVDQLNFSTYIPSKKQIKHYGPYGGNGGIPFDLSVLACIFGRSGCDLEAFGIYEGRASSNYDKVKKQWETQTQVLSGLLFPNQPYDFNQLKQEIIRLKAQELAPQVRNEDTKLTQLIEEVKNKVGIDSFASIVDLLLETQKQILQTNETPLQDKLGGKIEAYQDILKSKLNQNELQTLLTKQNELLQLKKHLESLQLSE